LCERLPTNLAAECDDFVNTYTDELVELLLADLTPQEVCVYLKLCSDSQPATGIIGGDPCMYYKQVTIKLQIIDFSNKHHP
jgi:hypothetical protein